MIIISTWRLVCLSVCIQYCCWIISCRQTLFGKSMLRKRWQGSPPGMLVGRSVSCHDRFPYPAMVTTIFCCAVVECGRGSLRVPCLQRVQITRCSSNAACAPSLRCLPACHNRRHLLEAAKFAWEPGVLEAGVPAQIFCKCTQNI